MTPAHLAKLILAAKILGIIFAAVFVWVLLETALMVFEDKAELAKMGVKLDEK